MKKENLREQIRRMEQELLSEEFAEDMDETDVWEELGPGCGYDRAMYADEDYSSPQEKRSEKNANTRGLKYLLLLEILGILALIGWWIRWLI